jgi:hypothetical protein
MFHPLSRPLMLWKALLCIFILFESFSMTIRLFFNNNWDSEYRFLPQFEVVFKIILVLDILVVCNTGIFRSGAVIFNRKEALKHYLRKGFLQDFISLVVLFLPFYSENYSETTTLPALLISSKNLLKFLFLLKIHQISRVYKYLEEILFYDESYEGLLSLMKLFFHIIVISHLIACSWNFVAAMERGSANPTWYDKIFYETSSTPVKWSKEYLYSWYWSLTTMITVGYGDISPKNDIEVAIASLAMLFGCGFFAYAISSIGIIVEKFSMQKKNLR